MDQSVKTQNSERGLKEIGIKAQILLIFHMYTKNYYSMWKRMEDWWLLGEIISKYGDN